MNNRVGGIENLIGRAVGVDFAVVQQHHAVADAAHAARVVRDDDRCAFQLVAHLDDELIDTVGDDRVQSGGWLVVKDDLRLVNNGPGQPDALFHAAGQLGRFLTLRAAEIHQLEGVGDGFPDCLRGHCLLAVEQEADVLLDGQRVEQCRALEEHSELAAHLDELAFGKVGDALAVDFHVALVRLHQPDDVPEQDAFATAAAADDDD